MSRRFHLLSTLLLFFSSAATAGELTKIDLFESGKDGYALYRIPGIVVTRSGVVLAYCEARKSDSGDWGPIDVLMRRSTDGGRTWLPRQQVVHVEGDLPLNPVAVAQNLDKPGQNTVNNPVAIVDHETGAIHFLYCLEYMRCFYLRSDDDGATWSEPVEITKTFEAFRPDYDWKVIATGPAHGIQLTCGDHSGRLVVPVWMSLGTGGHAHRPSVTGTIFSDDHGKTWQRGDIAVPNTADHINPNETVVVQLADGRVLLNTRSESLPNRRLVTTSPDGATGWSAPRFDDQLLEPVCMAGIVRVRDPQGDRPGLIAFSNPHNLSRQDGKEEPGKGRDRKNVTIKLSNDDALTWPVQRTLEEGFSGYSDLAALPDGTILCLYERGSTDGKSNYRTGLLTLARFDEDWVRAGDEADVCVYGGTSGGMIAAVQAARMGKRVVLVEPGKHLGGMTSGGLSAVDIGDPRSIGGLAREYFTRLVATYGKTLDWDRPFEGKGGPATGGAYSIEPHVAEQVFDEMAREAGVIVLRDAWLKSVSREGLRIVALHTGDGRVIRAKMFLDTTYEGDLMAAAGVTYTLTREGNAKYGEHYNGIHYADKYNPRPGHLMPGENGRLPGGQGVWDRDFPLDPYVVKGNPSSGLLHLLSEGEPGVPGDPAPGIQAYCFRLCLTTNPENRLPISPPGNYDPARYELVVRFIEACLANGDDMDLRWFSKHDPLPNDKWDFNTATFGGNLPGASWAWPEADHARRNEILQEHEDYHRGLLHFLATDPRVPEKVRRDMARFGLPKDEFTDHGGWPHQLYVREGRRMISDLVLTEHHTHGQEIAPHPVGLGSYGTDTHEIRRIVKDGVVTREGKTAGGRGGFGPYQIGYGAIVPKAAECENLFVTFALSASHTAFSSLRMEPVFMVTSQSAATAASLAIDAGVTVQGLDYEQLRTRLSQDGQIIGWPPGTSAKAAHATPNGILQDDTAGAYQGTWIFSSRQPSFIGSGYRHDNNRDQGTKSVRFTPDLPAAGIYEVRLIYVPTDNRARRATVLVHHADGDQEVTVNQREPLLVNGVPRALGRFRFEPGRTGFLEVSNKGADGFVVADGVQWVPVELADQERQGKIDAGFGRGREDPASLQRETMAAAVAVSPLTPEMPGQATAPPSTEPVQLAADAKPAAVDRKHFDLVVVGGTAGGVACAVRAAREGCTALLVQHNRHLGGMLSNGLMQWDALYGGPRAPLMTELLGNIEKDAITRFGKDSKNHQILRYTHQHYPVGWVEPHVMERECNRLVAGEKNLTLLLGHYPVAARRDGDLLANVTLRAYGTTSDITVSATMFADATYEGDLLALAKVPYRVGREGRVEYGEPHAGKVFVNIDHGPPQGVLSESLNIRPYSSRQGSVDPASPFTADDASQAYNYRFCVSRDPENRMILNEPPPGYDRNEYIDYERKGIATNGGPNLKSHMNSPILPGENHRYPEAAWPEREKIIDRHRNFALGLIWFLQNDESVPDTQRTAFRQWGLAKDEFPDHGHIPYEMYVREARRLVGRHVLTEHDGMLARDSGRTPVHADSVAVTDWYMDSHACTTDSRPGYKYDGKLILTEESRPMQIPYRALLPQGIDNLLVPVCLSSTHVAWGAIRLEPVWMQTGEAAGVAAGMAKQLQVAPANLDPDALIRQLAGRRHLICFFNDLKVDGPEPWIPAAQYFGTRGFFPDYDVRSGEPLLVSTARLWADALPAVASDGFDPGAMARAVSRSEQAGGPAITAGEFASSFKTRIELPQPSDAVSLTRGEALAWMWRFIAHAGEPNAANQAR